MSKVRRNLFSFKGNNSLPMQYKHKHNIEAGELSNTQAKQLN